jgi:Family of unknown function (DUF6610)
MQTLGKDGPILKFVAHSKSVLRMASRYGWLPAARYTNLRDVREFAQLGFLDIDWRNYDFQRHLSAVKATRPLITVAKDVERKGDLRRTIDQADELAQYCEKVVIVPKARSLASDLNECIPARFILGYSVPTRYGGTRIAPAQFLRPVHLLGGRPDVQRRIAALMPVFSVDCNRFTLDARFGDYFDGETFRRHPLGGYSRCIRDSIKNINRLWVDYQRGKL